MHQPPPVEAIRKEAMRRQKEDAGLSFDNPESRELVKQWKAHHPKLMQHLKDEKTALMYASNLLDQAWQEALNSPNVAEAHKENLKEMLPIREDWEKEDAELVAEEESAHRRAEIERLFKAPSAVAEANA